MSNRFKNDAPGMLGYRTRDEDGELRHKRGDTLVKTIEHHYNIDLGVRGDTRLDTLLKRTGAKSLKELLNK